MIFKSDSTTNLSCLTLDCRLRKLENPTLNAQVMAQKIASALERGWYYRRAGASAAVNIMDAGARGVIVTVAGKLTGARNRTQKFILGHVKYCGETALQFMDKGYAVAVKKLGTIGVTVQIMRKGITYHTRLAYSLRKSYELEQKQTLLKSRLLRRRANEPCFKPRDCSNERRG